MKRTTLGLLQAREQSENGQLEEAIHTIAQVIHIAHVESNRGPLKRALRFLVNLNDDTEWCQSIIVEALRSLLDLKAEQDPDICRLFAQARAGIEAAGWTLEPFHPNWRNFLPRR